MSGAVSRFQKNMFVLLLYVASFSGVITDITMGGGGKTGLYLAFDLVIIFLSLLSLGSLRSGLGFIVLFLIMCFVFNMSYSEASLVASLNGIREILILIALVIFYNKVFNQENEELKEEYLQIMKKFAVIFLAVNVPVAAVQFIMYGASDRVGGTFGNLGSGVLTLTVLCLVFFMSHFVKSLSERILLYAGLLPLVMNETKVSFILIPLTILMIHFQPKIKNIVIGATVAFLFLLVFDKYYTNQSSDYGESNFKEIFSSDFIGDYLFGDIYYSYDVPRFTKIIVAWQMIQEEINIFLFGFEYGLFKGGNMVEDTALAAEFQWLIVGTRPYLFFLLLQGGVLLVTGILLMMAHINRFFRNPNKYKTFLFIIFFITLFYNDSFRNQGFCVIYFFLVFYANSSLYGKKTEELN